MTTRRRITRGGSTRRNGGALSQFEPAIQRHIEGYIGSDPSWIQYRLGGHGGGIMNNIRSFLPSQGSVQEYDPLEWGLQQRIITHGTLARNRITALGHAGRTRAQIQASTNDLQQRADVQARQAQAEIGYMQPLTRYHHQRRRWHQQNLDMFTQARDSLNVLASRGREALNEHDRLAHMRGITQAWIGRIARRRTRMANENRTAREARTATRRNG